MEKLIIEQIDVSVDQYSIVAIMLLYL